MNTHEVPLRERVRAQLLELISEMDLTVNTRLLSEGQLAAKFQVSRSTIRTVLSDLEVEGKVIRRQGSGTYVNSQAIQVNTTLYPRIDLREIVARNGYSARSEVLSVRQIPAGRQSLLFNCGPTHQLQEIRSLYYADEFPCMYCIDCIRDGRITEEMVKQAAKLAGLDGAIGALPEGYDTLCTDGMFSQGEWQLLSIARAAAADPAILLLDEITANLDAETEARVLEALRRASKGRTVLSISHRIYENLGGRTVEIGDGR